MSTLTTIALGFAGCGGLAALAWFVTSKMGSKGNIMEAVHSVTQKIGQEKISDLQEKQNKVKMEINIKEDVAEEVKVKIDKIKNDAAEEINQVLKENNISRIHTIVDSEWEDL